MPKASLTPAPDWREARRRRAWELYQRNWSQARIAASLGVTQGAVSQWLKSAREGGLAALRPHPSPGRRAALTEEQGRQIPTLLARGAKAYGFDDNRWALRRVAAALEHVYGVRYHPAHVSRLLRTYYPNWQESNK